jgi:hypothetical protein
MLTQERLKQVLDYDPNTGIFTYKIDRANKRAGDVAGHVMLIGYVTITVDYKAYYAHHLAVLFMTGSLPPKKSHVDHRNGKEAENNWDNIRVTTPLINNHNRTKGNKNNTSGMACIRMRGQRFRVVVGFKWKNVFVGSFETLPEAIAAREAFRAGLPIH